MYSHDTYGLGHITRTLRIARALRDRYAHASILILSGSPVAPYMPLPPGADLVKLPSVVKSGPDTYRSRDLEVSFSQIKKIRRDLILGTAEAYRPHLFLVDNVPLGMKSEVLPTLRALRTDSPGTRIILNLRDILDDPRTIREAWERDGVPEVLDLYYDRIFVLGDESVFDARTAYRLPASKTTHVGYAAPTPRRTAPERGGPRRRSNATPEVLLTAGGGGDGAEFLQVTMEGIASLVSSAPRGSAAANMKVTVVTGPLMDPKERRRIAVGSRSMRAELYEFVPDLPQRMGEADLVIAMAGYNTCCEILSHARAALVLPRVKPRVEQLMRARAFERRGLVRTIEPQEISVDTIRSAVEQAIHDGPRIDAGALPEMDGLSRLAEQMGIVCPTLVRQSVHRDARSSAYPNMRRTRGHTSRGPSSSRGSFWYWPGVTAPASTIRFE